MQIVKEQFKPKTTIAGTLKALEPGKEAATFPLSKRAVVESTAYRIKQETGSVFTCRAEDGIVKVWLISKETEAA